MTTFRFIARRIWISLIICEIRKAMTKPMTNPMELAAISVAGTFFSLESTVSIIFSPRLRKNPNKKSKINAKKAVPVQIQRTFCPGVIPQASPRISGLALSVVIP